MCLTNKSLAFGVDLGATGRRCDFVLGQRGRKAARNLQVFTLMHHGIQQVGLEDDDVVNGKNPILVSRHLRLSHLFPRQPDGQSQTSGPTHLPPFIHMGSHTPAERAREG